MSGFSLKDHLFNKEKVTYLADQFRQADASFERDEFIRRVMLKLKKLELKQRIALISETLDDFLDSDFRQSAKQVVAALPEPLDETLADDDFGDFIIAPLGVFVVRHGLSKTHLKLSLKTLKEITKRFTMEDAIRPFIREFPDETLSELHRWSSDSNYHVRRLVSEGTRPSLPWSGKLQLDPATTLPLLDNLHSDATRYVTRSVANHLNDLSKTDPLLVVDTLKRWHESKEQSPAELKWMTRHALRTLVKAGHPDALAALGYRKNPKIDVSDIRLAKNNVSIGETLTFEIEITAQRRESLIVDYEIDFMKANGKRSAKVFKVSSFELQAGESKRVTKKHKLLANATTFKLYPGLHHLAIQVNGKKLAVSEFQVIPSSAK